MPLPTFVSCPDRIQAADLESGTWIVILRADEIPHVAMLQEGICYSLEHDSNRTYPARKLWRLLEARQIPAVLCELGPEARGSVAAIYSAHDCIEGDGDCFLPVRDYCATWLPEAAACSFPYELVPLLSATGRFARASTRNLPTDPATSGVVLPTYTREQIRERIAEVRRTIRANGTRSPEFS